jgi:hypothetical protein
MEANGADAVGRHQLANERPYFLRPVIPFVRRPLNARSDRGSLFAECTRSLLVRDLPR